MIVDLLQGWAELEDAAPGYDKAMSQYDGTYGEVFTSPRIQAVIGATGEEYPFNLVKLPVAAVANRVKIKAVTVPNGKPQTDRISEIWEANDLDVLYPIVLRRTFIFGDMYVSVWPILPDVVVSQEGTPEPAPDQAQLAAGVEIAMHDPMHTRIIYDSETHRRKQFAINRWSVPTSGGKTVWRVNLYYPTGIERWISVPDGKINEASGWTMYLEPDEDEATWLQPNESGEIPFFHYRTDLPYGRPEHKDGYGPQNAITKMLITMVTTWDGHGWPQRYKLTDAGAELDQAGDAPDWDDDANASTISPTGMAGVPSSQRTGPGTIMTFTGTKQVGQWDAAQPSVYIDPTELFVRLMATLTETPLHYFDPSGDVPSGESLKVADKPLRDRVEWLTTILRGPIVETWRYVLDVLGTPVERVTVTWAPIDTASSLDDWQTVKAKQDAGVPQDQTLVEAGYAPEQVGTWLDSQAEAMDLTHRVTLLNAIGDALTKLGAVTQLGFLDEAELAGIVARILPQAAPAKDPNPA